MSSSAQDSAQEREIRLRVETALRQLSVLDRHLLTNDANERALRHRLAVQLEKHFDNWDVDCEYDGVQRDQKLVDELAAELATYGGDEPLVRDTSGRTVHPDIIIHHRGSSQNLLAVEVKKDSSRVPDQVDRAKLALQKDDPRLAYRYACLVRIRVGPAEGATDGPADTKSEGQLFEIEFL